MPFVCCANSGVREAHPTPRLRLASGYERRVRRSFNEGGGLIRFFKKLCEAQPTNDPDGKANAMLSAAYLFFFINSVAS
jgi:hypothetical protein